MGILAEAIEFAKEKHGKQMYGSHPYFYHLQQVLDMANYYNYNTELLCVAVLHDTIEDTETTWTELKSKFGSLLIADTVQCLSRYEWETYPEYLEKVSYNKNAKAIKILDLLCNLKESTLQNKTTLIEKYEGVIVYLVMKSGE